MAAPLGAVPERAGEVVSPDACTHLTGADHVASLTAALPQLSAQLGTLDRWGALLADVLCGPGRGRLLAAGNGGSAAQAQHLTAELVGRYRADDLDADAELRFDGDKLVLRIRGPHAGHAMELQAWSDDVFGWTGVTPLSGVIHVDGRGADGRVTALRMNSWRTRGLLLQRLDD